MLPSASTLLPLLAIYAGFLAFLYAFQDHLVFFPQRISEERWKQVAEDLNADYVTIQVVGGSAADAHDPEQRRRVNEEDVHLRGWFLSGKGERAGKAERETGKLPTVLFFGGNAMRLDFFAYMLEPLREAGINIFLVDYRGYGLSEGKPSAETMKHDAVKLFDAAASHPLVDKEHITAWGISLGTAVAAHLASVRPPVLRTVPHQSEAIGAGAGAGVEKLILLAPFTSSYEVARDMFPFVWPLRPLIRHRFDTLALAPTLKQPVLIVQGLRDRELAPESAKHITDAWGGPKELLLLPDHGHNDLLEDAKVWETVVRFATKE